MKQSLEKRPTRKRDTMQKPDLIGDNPAAYPAYSGKSLGIPMVELATPNETNNLTEGTNKNGSRVKGMSKPK